MDRRRAVNYKIKDEYILPGNSEKLKQEIVRWGLEYLLEEPEENYRGISEHILSIDLILWEWFPTEQTPARMTTIALKNSLEEYDQ